MFTIIDSPLAPLTVEKGNIGGAVAGFIFQSRDAPHYRTGHGILIAMCSITIVIAIFMTTYLRRENARRDAAYKHPLEYTFAEKGLEADKGDNASFFRYTV